MTRLSATYAHITQIWKAVAAITVDPASVQIGGSRAMTRPTIVT
jgi:hypothetical protein